MEQKIRLDCDHEFSLSISYTSDLLFTFTCDIINGQDDPHFWSIFFEQLIIQQTSDILDYNTIVKLSASLDAKYEQRENRDETEIITRSFKYPINLHKEIGTRSSKINKQLKHLFYPMESLGEERFNEIDYNLVESNEIKRFSFSLTISLVFNSTSLPACYTLPKHKFNHKSISYVHNADVYCVMHTIYHLINKLSFTIKPIN